jgi:ligand-binding sensor domain-containing protein
VSGTNLFAGTTSSLVPGRGVGGVYRSTDQGGSWTAVNNGLPADAIVTALAADDQGESWIAVNEGLTSLGVRALAVAGGKLFAGTFGSGVFGADVTQ